ncbi:MAG: hypothetical protein Q4A27_03465 [bacterium]|nr:hypothetical protein [bacterium]
MTKTELLYEHYKDSNTILRDAQYQRELYMRSLFILEAVNFIFLYKQDFVVKTVNGILKSYNVGIESIADLSQILQIIMWILISYFLVGYFQKNIYIERQYGYINDLENEIAKIGGVRSFNRESSNYSKEYPLFLNLVDIFYKIIIPILFLIVHTIKIISELNDVHNLSWWVCIFKVLVYLWTIMIIIPYLHKMKKSIS